MIIASSAGGRPTGAVPVFAPPRPPAVEPGAGATPGTGPDASGRVLLGGNADAGVTYAKPAPRVVDSLNLWRSAHADPISSMMLGNSGTGARTLAERWRGLGGALLHHLATTGEGFRQTLVQAALPAAAPAAAALAEAPPAAVLDDVGTGAAALTLSIQTRSGHAIALAITVNDGQHGGTRGLQVEATTSGPLDAAEREALEGLAAALDPALEALGQGTPQVDLSGLLASEQAGAFAALDLSFEDPTVNPTRGAMHSLTLQVEGGRRSIGLKGAGGEMKVAVDGTSSAGVTTTDQRRAEVERVLEQIDAAGQRGHADRRMLGAFKQTFSQLQAPEPAVPDKPPAALPAEAGKQMSGLADFEASFSGAAHRQNRLGFTQERSRMDYHLAQQSAVNRKGAAGGQSIEQVQSESTNAVIQRSRTLMLDMDSGNYDEHTVQDRMVRRTLIETDGHGVLRALRKTDEQRLLRVATLDDHHITAQRETPLKRNWIERLA